MTVILASGCAEPARTDGTVTAWIGENNEMFMKCSDGVTRKLSAPMKDILSISETDVVGLTQANQVLSVKRDGSGYSILSANATEEEIAGQTDRTFQLEAGKLTVGDTVISEKAAAAATDGILLYWVNREDNGYTLMYQGIPGKEKEAAERALHVPKSISVPEPISLCVTGEAIALTGTDRSITVIRLDDGKVQGFPPSGQLTVGACMADNRLYRYTGTETLPWMLETIQNDAIQLSTVTPAPANTPAPTLVPTVTPRPTAVRTAAPTAAPRDEQSDGIIYKGARGSTVRRIQRRLQELGYPVGYADGDYGEQTQVAVNLFYDAIHVRERSYITPHMRSKLFARNAPEYDPYMPLQKGDRGLSVLYMQMMLKKIGYDPVKLDGIYGEMTIKAVAEYQKLIGYVPAEKEVPGEYASHELLEKLLGPEPTTTPTAVPTETPKPTAQPTAAPAPTAAPTDTPTPAPTPVSNTNL